ncbi:MAG: CehA/McbA family metallohydrolase, partial [Bryobacteraceae bacterium]
RRQWSFRVDLGVVARVYPMPDFAAARWLDEPYKGLGAPREAPREVQRVLAEIDAAADATLTVAGGGSEFHFDLTGGPRIEVIEPASTTVHARVVDAATGRPTAARVAFLSPAGRYIAPYGHAEDINIGWMQNTGADVKIGGASFAIVDSSFQIDLPAGDVYVEISKGFEYAPVRRKLTIAPGQRDLRLDISRAFDTQPEGWHTADTHVHIGSPDLLVLEGAAEGVHLVNLLAAQWGRHFTSMYGRPGRFAGSTKETTVWVGSENRHHFLGHIGLLGLDDWVLPLSEGGPPVAYFGQPTRHTLAEWADACRAQKGLTVGMHFPIPNGETAADVVLGKLDAAEVRFDQGFATLGVTEYYRYLNGGCRLAAVGGTDKMFPTRAVGAVRTYARLERGEEFSFDAWSRAVRAGRTFVTCGPLLLLSCDGTQPGGEIDIGGGREVEVLAEVRSVFPAAEVEIVFNGQVVARGAPPLREKLKLDGAGWIAARCASRDRLTFGMRNIGAHTSPVYVRQRGGGAFSRDAAEYMLRLVDGSKMWLETLATAAPDDRARMGAVFGEARRRLEESIRRNTSLHP